MWQKIRMGLIRFLWRNMGCKFLLACCFCFVGAFLILFPGFGIILKGLLGIVLFISALLLTHFASFELRKELPEYKIDKIVKERWEGMLKNHPGLGPTGFIACYQRMIHKAEKTRDLEELEKWLRDYDKMLGFEKEVKILETAIPAIQKEIDGLPDKLGRLCKRRGEIPNEIRQAKKGVEKIKKKLLS